MLNWNQAGMPSALVSRLGQRREVVEFKTVLNDARNHIRQPVDAEAMAQELVASGGREFVEMVRGLTTALENAQKELEDANQRYERLVADLGRRGVSLVEDRPPQPEPAERREERPEDARVAKPKSAEDGQAEWEEWDRRFRALLQ